MGNSINWHRLAEQVGTLNDTGESGGDDYARQALELINGMEVVEKLAWSELVFPEECQALLEKATQHSHPDVRELAKEISELFRNRDS